MSDAASGSIPYLATTGRAAPPGFEPVTNAPTAGFYLESTDRGLVLQHAGAAGHDQGLCIDLLDGHIERRVAAGRKSPMARALGLKRRPQPTVLDCTCGLGRDSATLAALGARVHALERHPVLFALLNDAMTRAGAAGPLPAWLANWNVLEHADALVWLEREQRIEFDIVYIDPMFAAERRKARPQKALAWLAELIGSDTDAHELLALARRHALRQTVVKQHARSKPIAPPDRQVHAKAVRFDIYLAPVDKRRKPGS